MTTGGFCGVDFGTSNSTAGIMAAGAARMCRLEGEHATLPSAIFFDYEARATRFGRDAVDAYVDGRPGRLLRALKSVLGSSLMRETTVVNGRRIAFREIIGLFVARLKAKVEAEAGRPVDSVVLGRPVRFVDGDDAADRQAEAELVAVAHAAGFRHVAMQFEPVAAALDYERRLDREELAFIVDLGGGTSDFAVVRLSPVRARAADRAADILATSGVHIGGTDFDHRLSIDAVMPKLGYDAAIGEKRLPLPRHLFHDLATWHRIQHVYTDDNLRYLARARRSADDPASLARLIDVLEHQAGHRIAGLVEAAKIALSGEDAAAFALPAEPPAAVTMTRAGLDAALAADAGRIAEAALACCARAGVEPGRIGSVFLTGGSTAIPCVRARILDLFPTAGVVSGDLFGSVGVGLALDAARKFDHAPA